MDWLRLDNRAIAAWAFDFDDNILSMPTSCFYQRRDTGKVEEIPGYEVQADPSRFSWDDSEYVLVNGDQEQSFQNFRCVSPYLEDPFTGLLHDVEQALSNQKLAPSFTTFKDEFLVKWRIWSIITARWNSPDNLQRALEFINDQVLTKAEKEEQQESIIKNFWLPSSMQDTQVLQYYFREAVADYICCDNSLLRRQMWLSANSWAERKVQAMDWWIQEVHRKLRQIGESAWKDINNIITAESPLSIWFSDDSPSNIIAMANHFESKIPKLWSNHKGRIFFTGKEKDLSIIKERLHTWIEIEDNEIRFQ